MLIFNNILNKTLKVGLYFSEYVYLTLYQNINIRNIFITSKFEIVLEMFYFDILELVLIFINKSNFRFNKISDIVVYDRPSYKIRFVVSYIFSNADREFKIRTRFSVNSTINIIMSISEILHICSWAEREAMDLFGLKFLGHRDMRRILGDYGLWGFPGRKDYPLVGIYSYFYVINFLRVFRIRGMLRDFWSIYFQKKIYTQC